MKITNNYQSNQNFNGKIIFLNERSKLLADTIRQNPFYQNLASGKQNLYVTINSAASSKKDIYRHGADEEIYKITFAIKEETRTLFGKILSLFTQRKFTLSRKYHSESTNYELLQNTSRIKRILK